MQTVASSNFNILVIGMAGSGKTTFVNSLSEYFKQNDRVVTTVNLDPAVYKLPYQPDIDIRNIVDYKDVMKTFELGPNGAIITSVNIFATKLDQFNDQLRRLAENSHVTIIDTPGQIEVFTWSASGNIITEALAQISPTFIAFVIDTPRSNNPNTFISNMLYSLSCMYKTKIPLLIIFNKIDVSESTRLVSWLSDYDSLQEHITSDSSFSSNLASSLSLSLEEFYSNLKHASVSSKLKHGFDNFIGLFSDLIREFNEDYRPLLSHNTTQTNGIDQSNGACLGPIL